MKENTIEGVVTLSGEFEDSHDKSKSIRLRVKPPKGRSVNIICSKDHPLEVDHHVRIKYNTNPDDINLGNHYLKLDPSNHNRSLKSGYLRKL
jgi:hypothetical protein